MDGDDVSTGFGEVGDALLGLHNHLRKRSKERAVQSRLSYRALPDACNCPGSPVLRWKRCLLLSTALLLLCAMDSPDGSPAPCR